MKKLVVLTLAGIALFTSCENKSYQLSGQIEGAKDGDTLFLAKLEGNDFVPSDTLIVEKGTFTVTGKLSKDSTQVYSYYYSNGSDTYSNIFFLEPGNIHLKISKESKVTGSKTNDIYQSMLDTLLVFHNQMNQSYENMIAQQDSTQKELELQALEGLEQKVKLFIQNCVEQNIENSAGYVLLLTNYTLFTPQKVNELIGKLPQRYQDQAFIQELKEQLQPAVNDKEGIQFTDFTLPDPNGNAITVSNIVKNNKLTLIDCWASWCGPCIQEMPTLVEAYKKYHSKGLEIIGVSLDNKKENWTETIHRLNMTWPQVSDLKGWQSIITALYGVKSIPYTILVDQNGNIVAENLRGSELDSFIANALK